MDREIYRQCRWRQVAAYALVLALGLAIVAGCASATATPHAKPHQATPSGMLFGPTPISYDPGWFQVLSGYRLFEDSIYTQDLISSLAQPGHVAGCLLPVGYSTAVPRFVLSDDAGLHWQALPIPGAHATNGCMILADTMRPDTFALAAAGITLVTTDAGKSWRTLTTPCGNDVNPVALVNGRLLAGICSHGGDLSLSRLAITTLTPDGKQANGAWVTVKTDPLHVEIGGNALEGYASDVQDIAHIYALVSTGAFGMTLYATTNGGASWQALRSWADIRQMRLWTAAHDQVFVEDLLDKGGSSTQFFYSGDSGATWHDSGLHQRDSQEPIFISPQGRVIEDAPITGETGNLFQLDPRTGVFTFLTSISFSNAVGNGFTATLVDGPRPTFIYTSMAQTAIIPIRTR